jgi:hypothetical protein
MKAAKWDDDVTDFSLSCIFDATRMHSSCILRILTKEDLHIFRKRLNEVKDLACSPYLLPALLIETRLQNLPKLTSVIRRFLYRVEKTTGTYKNYRQKLGLTKWKSRTVHESFNDPEFVAAPAELTSLASDCAYYESACRSRRSLLLWLVDMHQQDGSAGNIKRDDMASKMIAQKLQFMVSCATETESRIAYLGKRAEIQMQMVCIQVPPAPMNLVSSSLLTI